MMHAKTAVVDGKVGFVSGLCVAQDWLGFPERGIEPWRDTGVELRGPAVADLERAFGDIWALNGKPLSEEEIPQRKDLPPLGSHTVRVIPSSPESTGLLRLDLLWAAIARKHLWLADAYFIGTPAYIGALCSAAKAGVDVRLLVPTPCCSVLADPVPTLARGRGACFRVERPDDARKNRRRGWRLVTRRLYKPERRELGRQLGA
jgi:phosphatidylserine/phosphatidylglycerophosphate/cardiolipin synthase-like enzyme